jgi:hypothetical protein
MDQLQQIKYGFTLEDAQLHPLGTVYRVKELQRHTSRFIRLTPEGEEVGPLIEIGCTCDPIRLLDEDCSTAAERISSKSGSDGSEGKDTPAQKAGFQVGSLFRP